MRGKTDHLPRCGAMMRQAKEPCARMAGHAGEHRTRYCLDNTYRMKIGREVSRYVVRQGELVPR